MTVPSTTTLPRILFAAGLLAIFGGFGISYGVIHSECKVTYCPAESGERQDMTLDVIYVYYAYLLGASIALYFLRRHEKPDSILRTRPSLSLFGTRFHLPFSLGELLFVLGALAIAAWKFTIFYKYYFKNGVKPGKGQTWQRAFWNSMTHVNGNPLDVMIGFTMLPISRHSPLATLLGVPFDGAIRIHRFMGYGTFAWAVFHASSFFTKIANQDRNFKGALFNIGKSNLKFESWRDCLGFIAFSCFVIGFIPSLPWIRRRHFNTFYVLHGFMLLMIMFAILHSQSTFFFVIPGLILWSVDLTLRATAWFTPTHISSITHEPCGYLRLDITTRTPFFYTPAQYAFLSIPSISRVEYHPYSLCGRNGDSGLTVLLDPAGKRDGEWTSKLAKTLLASADAAGTPKGAKTTLPASVGTKAHFEGPFGCLSFSPVEMDAVVCFVSGTGLAPALAVARAVVDAVVRVGEVKRKQVVVYWSVRREGGERLSLIQ
ncbi:ferric/cupric-chelate reductase, partial [Borealophlyctis nickersoniae]